jgi:hypothetical protein
VNARIEIFLAPASRTRSDFASLREGLADERGG